MQSQSPTPASRTETPREPLVVQEHPSDEYRGRAQLLLLEFHAAYLARQADAMRESEPLAAPAPVPEAVSA